MTRLSLLILLALAGCRAPGPVALVAPPAPQQQEKYLYTDCEVTRTVDGDTLIVAIPERVRLLNIDCPELSTERGRQAKAEAEKLVKDAQAVRVRTNGVRDVYGRLLAVVELKISGRWESLADRMRAAGWVK